ncbi:MAG: glycosyltransferase family 9 protein [Candidatus Omnitrophica bacterium]|nr:glycosyltransferase family 9 protein [Candidatus Omnitrophota bacterium]
MDIGSIPHSQLPNRIVVIRLDRIGDVVLSTPVIQALREAFPSAFIAMMVRPVCRELVEGNPSLNEVVLYDKDGAHRGWLGGLRFALGLRRFGFDTALVLHPTVRSHVMVWLAGIPARIGYGRKAGWLLTRRLPHRKHEGAKSEAAYALEMLRAVGIEPAQPPPAPLVPIRPEAQARVDAWLMQQGIAPGQLAIAVHPAASARSKRWSAERFAEVADRLIAQHQARIVLIAGPRDAGQAQAMERAMRHRAVSAVGQLSLGELACLFVRCRLLIANDSGPVHIAAAVGTPVVAIFGRNQPGLGATRWGPVGPGHTILQKDVGCPTCLAERCQINFLCLSALPVEEVYAAACAVLDRPETPGVRMSHAG